MFLRFLLTFLLLLSAAFAQRQPTLLVLLKMRNELAFIDPATKQITGTVAVGNGPHEITLSSDRRKAYVSNYGTGPEPGSTVSIIDVAARKELKRLDVSPLRRPHGFFANGNKVYITAEANRLVARIDIASDAIDWMVGTGQGVTHMVTGDTAGKNLYTANITAGTVTKIDMARANGGAPDAVAAQTVGKQPEGIRVSPDGKELWVGLNGEGKVVILDADSMQLKDTITGHKVPIRITFTPDGARALVSDVEAAQVAIYDVATRKELKRVPVQGTPIGTVISGDGKRAYVASMMAGRIAVIDLTRNEVIDYIEAPGGPDGIALLD